MVKKRVVRAELVATDLQEHIDYITRDNPTTASRLVKAVQKAIDCIAEIPKIGAVRGFANPRIADVRMWPVPKFPKYLIFYQETADSIRILRILHSARDLPALFADEEG